MSSWGSKIKDFHQKKIILILKYYRKYSILKMIYFWGYKNWIFSLIKKKPKYSGWVFLWSKNTVWSIMIQSISTHHFDESYLQKGLLIVHIMQWYAYQICSRQKISFSLEWNMISSLVVELVESSSKTDSRS